MQMGTIVDKEENDALGSVSAPPKVIQEALSRDSFIAAGTLIGAK